MEIKNVTQIFGLDRWANFVAIHRARNNNNNKKEASAWRTSDGGMERRKIHFWKCSVWGALGYIGGNI